MTLKRSLHVTLAGVTAGQRQPSIIRHHATKANSPWTPGRGSAPATRTSDSWNPGMTPVNACTSAYVTGHTKTDQSTRQARSLIGQLSRGHANCGGYHLY